MTRTRIAILGGGVGALTAAFHLTSAPDWRARYDVTVYQMGWRLGGKGASGRNREHADRIEEHGFHLLFGFYDNAFALLRRLYGELARPADAPLARWDQAFEPHRYFVLEEEVGDRTVPWQFEFPDIAGEPGQGAELPAPWTIVKLLLAWARELFGRHDEAPAMATVAPDRLDRIVAAAAGQLRTVLARGDAVMGGILRRVHAAVDWIAEQSEGVLPSVFLHAAERHAERQPADARDHDPHEHAILLWLLRGFRGWLKGHWSERARADIEIRRTLVSLDALISVAIGMIADDLITPPVDWFKIDGASFEDWLIHHGADPSSAAAPPVLLLRQLVFGHRTGVGAGTCLHYALRMVYTYRGAFAYKMQSGMGDAVFAPLYEVLSARGVRFEFFHAVEQVIPGRGPDGPVIDAIRIAVQAETVGGAPYRPLIDIGGLPCWPSEPLYDQLVQGDELRRSGEHLENWWSRWPAVRTRELVRGTDFDHVVLGISIGAYPEICRSLIDETPKFARMVERVGVTDTQAAQLWLDRDVAALGWPLGSQPIIGTSGEPFDTIADMSHVLPRERWRAGAAGSIVYLTSQLAEGPRAPTPPRTEWRYPHDQRARVWANLNRWIDDRVRRVFPDAAGEGGFQWDRLVDPSGATGRDRLAAQFWIGCWNPSDRYVLSAPGSASARLPSAGTGYRNLVMAGDWTRTALGAGCVEAAVMSGMHAARALCGTPARISGDDLPDGNDVPAPPPLAPPVGPRPGSYIELDASDPPLPPYTARNVTMYSFALEADVDRLRALCDRQLNLGGPVEYRPLGPFVFFVAATMSPISPARPAAWTDEKDFGFWVPLVAGRRGAGGAFHAERPVFYIPYLWVDSDLAAQAGREVFGYPKAVGRLANPSSPDAAAEFSIDAQVVPEPGPPGAPGARWQWRRLVTAARRDAGAWGNLGNLARELGSVAELGRAVVSALAQRIGDHALPAPSLALLASLLRDALALDVPMVFLKQFRDAADATAACYQAIVEAPNRMTGDPVEAGFLPGDWELAIEQYPTLRLIDRLGLRAAGGKLPALLHIWVKFGFTAEPGRVIWRAV